MDSLQKERKMCHKESKMCGKNEEEKNTQHSDVKQMRDEGREDL
jgi:hypothetical protein